MAKYQAYIFDVSLLRPRIADCECATEAEAINTMLEMAGRAPAELRLTQGASERPILRWAGRSGHALQGWRDR